MADDSDDSDVASRKDVQVGLATVGIVLATQGVAAAARAAIPTLVGLRFNVRRYEERRGATAIAQLIAADDAPDEFARFVDEQIRFDDDRVTGAIRSLLVAALDAVEPEATEPMAQIARRFIKRECPPWIARGFLRALAEVTGDELADLRRLVGLAAGCAGEAVGFHWAPGDRLLMRSFPAWKDVEDAQASRVEISHGRRLISLLAQHGLASGQLAHGTPLDGVNSQMVIAREVVDQMAYALTPRRA